MKVLIDKKLSWRNHIHTVATNISQTVAMLTNEDILYIYNTLITPRYVLMSRGRARETNPYKITILQKRAIGFIVFYRHGSEHARGVYMYLSETNSFGLEATVIDTDGRYIFAMKG